MDKRDDLLDLASRLIGQSTPNPPGEERHLAEIIARDLAARGIEATVLPLEGDLDRRANVLARIPGRGGAPPLVFCGHLDTVPAGTAWSRDPLSPAVEDGRLYGLGAADMKGAVAAMVVAAHELAADAPDGLPGDLILAFTCDEETGSAGARALAKAGLLDGAGGIVIGEPTGNRAGIAEKGGIWLDVTLRGRTAHGSLPHLGANAVSGLGEVLVVLERVAADLAVDDAYAAAAAALAAALRRPPHGLLGAPTMTPTLVAGGVATNVVPDHASATLDIRTLPGQDGPVLLRAVEGVAQTVAARRDLRAEVRSRGARAALDMPDNHPLVRATRAAIADVTGRPAAVCGLTGATDATELVPALGLPFVICGPGEMAQAHQPDEWVSVDLLRQSVQIYRRLAHHFWSRRG
jgi:succinyl-diaminopimelate desuccinylase